MRSDIRPVSQPFVAGCSFVVYESSDNSLNVVALDARTGRMAWQTEASRSAVTPGVSPELAVVGDTVVLLEGDADSQTARLVGLRSSDGTRAWATGAGIFTGWPSPCADNASTVCVTGESDSRTQQFRYDAATGEQLASPVVSGNSSGRDLAPDLFDPAIRDPDQLVAVHGGAIAWKRPLASIFNDQVSTDYGWNFDRVPEVDLFVGSVGARPLTQTGSSATIDLAGGMTAGFRIADGEPVWSAGGTQYACSSLPCIGDAPPSDTGAPEPPILGVRLRGMGTARVAIHKPPVLSSDAKFVLEGFDLATGRTTWSFDLGRNLSLVEGVSPPQLVAEQITIRGSNGMQTLLDLATGERHSVPPDATFWCQKEIRYKLPDAFEDAAGHRIKSFVGESAKFPCDARGRAIEAPVGVPSFVGPSIGGRIAWSGAGEVVAARAAA